MRKRWAWAAAILLAGCASSSTELLPTIQPDGGPSIILPKPYELVFAAAVRVANLAGETLSEASLERGRIVLHGRGPTRAIFLHRVPNGRTKVELSSGFIWLDPLEPIFAEGGFFPALREQIVIYEKREALEKDRRREIEEIEKAAEKGSAPPSTRR